VAVFPTPQRILDLKEQIASEREKYRLLGENRKSYRNAYVLMLALMTVLALFAAVWIGLNLSKRITVPIEALSVATREISDGNLNHRVEVQAEDELGMLVKLFNDMAERLQFTTEELEARRRYIEIILETIPTGVISLGTDLRIHTMNRAAHNMFSIENASRLDQIFGGDDLNAIVDLLEAARVSESKSSGREIEFSGPGRPTHSAVAASRLTAGDFVLVVEDLTEVVRAQKATAWREVARRLAHEIKNPLTPIQLSAERIARNVSRLPAATPKVATIIGECVETIVEEVSSLKHLVDEFVRFSRLPAVSRVPTGMKELVDRTMALYEDRLNGTRVSVNVPDDLPPVLMDSIQMKRVLVNVIDNALEALTEEKTQELRINCELTRDDTMARLTIADTGRGIAVEDRERLFTPYFSTRKDGTGLGLAISSRIVADHGGYIGVEPNNPKGTRFVIELPVCPRS
jgi:nitrogen fixation/metabolism regulation signal transduction histidine kinase